MSLKRQSLHNGQQAAQAFELLCELSWHVSEFLFLSRPKKQSQPAMTVIASYKGAPNMLAQSYAAGLKPAFGAHVRRTAQPQGNGAFVQLAMPQAAGASLCWTVPQTTPARRRARPCHALAQPVLEVASAPVLVFMIGRAVTAGYHPHCWQVHMAPRQLDVNLCAFPSAGILFYCTAQWWSTRQLRMQVIGCIPPCPA